METTELTKEDQRQLSGGSLIGDLARLVDNVLDVLDDLQQNGSNRPFKDFES